MTPEDMNLFGLYLFGVVSFYAIAFAGAEMRDYESPNLTRLAIFLWPLAMTFWLVNFVWEVTCDIFWTPAPPARGGHIMPPGNQI